MDAEARDRQFWVRVLLAAGMLVGTMPFITIPVVLQQTDVSAFEALAVILNGLTVLPACILGFWRRGIACLWLSVNAGVVLAALVYLFRMHGHVDTEEFVAMAGAILIAVCLDVVEFRRWPAALAR